MHIHTMGNKAVNRVVNAYVNGGKKEIRNTLIHVYGVNVSSHSDFPVISGSPDDPFGIIEIAVTGINPLNKEKAWWTE